MRVRSRIKEWFYGSFPGFAGSFPYYGTRIYFPRRSLLFKCACSEGTFESGNVDLLRRLARQGGTVLDVGANIGLMAAPILRLCPDAAVISFEPSPATVKYLDKTIAFSPYRSRWSLVPKALCDREGEVEFFAGSEDMGAFDGLADTTRGGPAHRLVVSSSKLDTEWAKVGKPRISAVKIDVEGAEMRVLSGALECISSQRPPVLLEWNVTNLQAHGVPASSILEFARQTNYGLHTVPGLVPVSTSSELALHMKVTESYLLWPISECIPCVAPS